MEIPRFEHGAWLARAWQHGAPRFNLGSSGFKSPIVGEFLPPVEAADATFMDLHSGQELQSAIAARDGLDGEQVCITAGTSAANLAAVAAFVRPGSNVVCERPTYLPLPDLTRAFGATVRWVDDATPERMASAANRDTSLFLLTSPNNPTGRAWSDADFVQLDETAGRLGATVIVDQVYRELTDHALAGRHANSISTSGFNKCWGAPGLRVGWAVGEAGRMERIRNAHRLLALAPPVFGLRAAGALLPHEAACRTALETHLEEVHGIYRAWCTAHGIDDEPLGLTAFPRLGTDLHQATAWLDDGLLVVPGELFGTTGAVRVGFGAAASDVAAGLEALGAAWQAQRF